MWFFNLIGWLIHQMAGMLPVENRKAFLGALEFRAKLDGHTWLAARVEKERRLWSSHSS